MSTNQKIMFVEYIELYMLNIQIVYIHWKIVYIEYIKLCAFFKSLAIEYTNLGV